MFGSAKIYCIDEQTAICPLVTRLNSIGDNIEPSGFICEKSEYCCPIRLAVTPQARTRGPSVKETSQLGFVATMERMQYLHILLLPTKLSGPSMDYR